MPDNAAKTNKRVLKTKRAIYNALLELMAEKNINELTITEIANAADINRKTIYVHYEHGIRDILDEIEHKVVNGFHEILSHYDAKEYIANPYNLIVSLTTALDDNTEFCSYLLKLNSDSMLIQQIEKSIKKSLSDQFHQYAVFPQDKSDFIINYIIAGTVATYQTWLYSNKEVSIETLSDIISSLILSGTKTLLLSNTK